LTIYAIILSTEFPVLQQLNKSKMKKNILFVLSIIILLITTSCKKHSIVKDIVPDSCLDSVKTSLLPVTTTIQGGATMILVGSWTANPSCEKRVVNKIMVLPKISGQTDSTFTNVTLYHKGSQVGATQNFDGINPITYNLGSNVVFEKDSLNKFEVRMDTRSISGISYSSGVVTTKVWIPIGGIKGVVTGNTNVKNILFPITNGLNIQSSNLITVYLAPTNPQSNYIIQGQSRAHLLDISFVGTGGINGLTLVRYGISNQYTLSNVYLYDGNTRISDGFSFNSAGLLTINTLSLIVNGSKTISVMVDVSPTATNGTIAIGINAFRTVNINNPINVIQGNMMTIVGAGMTTVDIGVNNIPSSVVSSGTNNVVWKAPISIGIHPGSLTSASFKIIGAVSYSSLSNLKLYLDGNYRASGSIILLLGETYAYFDFQGSPVSLSLGNHVLEVSSIITGSGINIQLGINQSSDLSIRDSQLDLYVGSSGVPNYGGVFTIN
jgi:hypothetical protein